MAQQSTRIVRELHDEPHVQGSRLTVNFIHERVEGLGLDPETVAEQHGIDLADVYHALAYYHDHPEEMRAVEEQRDARHEAAAKDPATVTGPEDSSE